MMYTLVFVLMTGASTTEVRLKQPDIEHCRAQYQEIFQEMFKRGKRLNVHYSLECVPYGSEKT